MRPIDADALIEFCAERWIPLNIDAVNMQPTIQPEKAQLSQEGTTSDQPVVTDIYVGDKISKFIDGLEEIFADLRERHVDDSVCGLCEYDGAYMGQSGDWCNECPGFEKDDCFKLSDETRKKWTDEIMKALPSAQPEPQWISVTERLPDNADHPGAFCPRYQVVTPYGVTEGWYRPHDHEKGGQWFALFWFMSQTYEIWNIDFEKGDVPKVIGEAPVMEWRPLPEPYKPNNK